MRMPSAIAIREPFQLMAALAVAVVIVTSSLLGAALRIEDVFSQRVLVVAAVAFLPAFGFLLFWLYSRHRDTLLPNETYKELFLQLEETFADFVPENLASSDSLAREVVEEDVQPDESALLEELRDQIYEASFGLALVHRWKPSSLPNQLADIAIFLTQHRSARSTGHNYDRPLDTGQIARVVYYLGPLFFGGKPIVKTDAVSGFRLELSAYGPFQCLAEIHFLDGRTPIRVSRYVDFDTETSRGRPLE